MLSPESHDLIHGLQVHPDIEDDKHAFSSTCLSITFNTFLLRLTSKQVYEPDGHSGHYKRYYDFSQDRSDTDFFGPELETDLALDDPRFELEGDEPPTYGIPCFYEGERYFPGIRGIVVRPKANEKNHFERIGSFELGSEGDDMAKMEFEEVIDYLYECQAVVQRELSEGFDVETKKYTITLV